MNFTYDKAPPILFVIEGFPDVYEFCFGGYPCQYITLHRTQYDGIYDVRIKAVETRTPIKLDKPWLIKYWLYKNDITFHPDHSNRIILQTNESVDVYKIIPQKGNSRVSREFSFQMLDEFSVRSLRNRKIIRPCILVHNFHYEPELNVLGILAERQNDFTAFVELFDNMTGENLRTIQINETNINLYSYSLYIHPCAIVILERGGWMYGKLHAVHVYMM